MGSLVPSFPLSRLRAAFSASWNWSNRPAYQFKIRHQFELGGFDVKAGPGIDLDRLGLEWMRTLELSSRTTGIAYRMLGTARFTLALAGMDVGTAFGGIGSSREMMIASLAEPAMLLIVFTVALVAGTTQLSAIATVFSTGPVGLRVSLALEMFAFLVVATAENARIPIDNPATHLELTMVHEAMVLEYSGRHLAMIEPAAALKLVLYFSLIVCLFVSFGIAFRSSWAARSPPRRSPCFSCSCRRDSDG
jgi:hypothetical protein